MIPHTEDPRTRLAYRLAILGNQRVRSLTARTDPSLTSNIVRMYRADLRRRLEDLARGIRKAIEINDVFGLRKGVLMIHVDVPPDKAFAFLDLAGKNTAFSEWLAVSVQKFVLEDVGGPGVTPAWIRKYIRAAYGKGAAAALAKIRANDPAAATANVQQILGTPFHLDRMAALFQQSFSELQGFSESMQTDIRRIIADGLLRGENPRTIAREASRRINLARYRAERIARTETIRANAEAQLNTFERFGVSGVELDAEWITAGDGRVCPDCASHGGKIYPIQEARGMIPLHPNCRCSWIPVQTT